MADTDDAHEHVASQHKATLIALSVLAVLLVAGVLIYLAAT